MKMIKMQCPSCRAQLEIDTENRNFAFCQYCGTKFWIDNEHDTNQTIHYFNEAELKKIEEETRRYNKEEIQNRKVEKFRIILLIALVFVGIIFTILKKGTLAFISFDLAVLDLMAVLVYIKDIL